DRLYGKVSRISGVTLQSDQNPEVLTPAPGDAAPETIRG
ncbi:MAG: recombinase, partial [Microcystis aeruginosa]